MDHKNSESGHLFSSDNEFYISMSKAKYLKVFFIHSGGVFKVDVSLSWKKHVKYIENIIFKNIGLLFKAKYFLNKCILFPLHYIMITSLTTQIVQI